MNGFGEVVVVVRYFSGMRYLEEIFLGLCFEKRCVKFANGFGVVGGLMVVV